MPNPSQPARHRDIHCHTWGLAILLICLSAGYRAWADDGSPVSDTPASAPADVQPPPSDIAEPQTQPDQLTDDIPDESPATPTPQPPAEQEPPPPQDAPETPLADPIEQDSPQNDPDQPIAPVPTTLEPNPPPVLSTTPDAQVVALTERLTEVYTRLYVVTSEADRPTLLTTMLADPIEAVRLLALRLIERKVLNAQQIDDSLRQVIRLRLDDAAPAVRVATAGLLRIVDDTPAVKLVQARILDEPDVPVQNAYLALLGRNPMSESAEPIIELLSKPGTTTAAADVLVRAVDAGVLQPEQKRRALEQAVQLADNGEQIEPSAVRLIGRLATAHQAELIQSLLDHDNPAVRLAAADAYVHGTLDMAPLMARLGDPVVGDKAVEAAARRSDQLGVALELLKHQPDNGDRRQLWRNAVAAIAGRINAADLRRLDDAVATLDNRDLLRLAVLRAALTLERNNHRADHVELLLRLADLQWRAGQGEAAGLTLALIEGDDVPEADRARWLRLRLSFQLSIGEHGLATQSAAQLLAADSATASWITAQLLDATERALATRKTEQAGIMLVQIQAMLGDSMNASDRQRYEKLRSQLNELTKPAETLGSTG